ncbi:tetratricopeptide repeat protein [Desulfonatronum parangueonense]
MACGWAYNPEYPDRRLNVEILCNGSVIATGRAERFREDLQQAGIGDGRYQFHVPIGPELFDGKSHNLTVRDAESGQEVPGGPLVFLRVPIHGSFDVIADDQAHGWAFDPVRPHQRLEVEIICVDYPDNPMVVARGSAEMFREDLPEAEIGDGRHAFILSISRELFDGQPHNLQARDARTKQVLSGLHEFQAEPRQYDFDLIPRDQSLEMMRTLFGLPEFAAHASDARMHLEAFQLACLLAETDRFEEARDAFADLIRIIGDNAICQCKIGETWLLQGRPDRALEAYQSAAKLDVSQHWAYRGMAHALRDLGRYIEAEDAFQLAMDQQPEDQTLRRWLRDLETYSIPARADELLAKGETDEAIRMLKRQLIIDPDSRLVADRLAQLLTERDKLAIDQGLPGAREFREAENARLLLDLILNEEESWANPNGENTAVVGGME